MIDGNRAPPTALHSGNCGSRSAEGAAALTLCGAPLLADPTGALLWPAQGVLAVADLHLEKGSAFAARGRMLPPYDTRATLERLAGLVARERPACVLCLGDSFHDRRASERMDPADVDRLRTLTATADWVWITGNHDPEPPQGFGGRVVADLTIGPLTFRHEARPGAVGELSGHLHPAAAVALGGRRVRERCFAHDGAKLILPAFGSFTGGLNVLDPAFKGLLAPGFEVLMTARGRVYRFPSARLAPDRAR
ncbi:ligase-associated DNA damage response endonuclease PdeM [Azospirillum picis]|uniref:DNA ligase-associated metallophosphoesterase n=1 Tax=Azospirillum picis TaxID=488438 RepID=A0ABU0ME54_9PROT|nr:ligase-associated DNA damage response endonuclease PdeM [Azospirillum picis]MBP2297877.1 DNA ligase-associated metallophosphoesterase [Azospirillum picis]MDQ0531715.1 DNA ligase-associated metallophosphoesterase [Azospirillum picis]